MTEGQELAVGSFPWIRPLSNCLLLSPHSLKMRSWLGCLSCCRRIVLPRPGSSLYRYSAAFSFCLCRLGMRKLGGGRAITSDGGGAVCVFLGIQSCKASSSSLFFSSHFFCICVRSEPKMPSVTTGASRMASFSLLDRLAKLSHHPLS